ncbi:MAG: acyl-CoA thioesterase, partial [Flammeovirgaceae bacterium]|nr:acyl-CoA thioesterase [Flammeovirgaceae bacterium]
VGGIRFFRPIKIGDLVEITAKVIYTGKTSMHVAVDVLAKNPREKEFVRTTHCIIVFVSVDENGHPQSVRKWVPLTDTDKHLEQYAQRLMALRQGIEQEMQEYLNQG